MKEISDDIINYHKWSIDYKNLLAATATLKSPISRAANSCHAILTE